MPKRKRRVATDAEEEEVLEEAEPEMETVAPEVTVTVAEIEIPAPVPTPIGETACSKCGLSNTEMRAAFNKLRPDLRRKLNTPSSTPLCPRCGNAVALY